MITLWLSEIKAILEATLEVVQRALREKSAGTPYLTLQAGVIKENAWPWLREEGFLRETRPEDAYRE